MSKLRVDLLLAVLALFGFSCADDDESQPADVAAELSDVGAEVSDDAGLEVSDETGDDDKWFCDSDSGDVCASFWDDDDARAGGPRMIGFLTRPHPFFATIGAGIQHQTSADGIGLVSAALDSPTAADQITFISDTSDFQEIDTLIITPERGMVCDELLAALPLGTPIIQLDRRELSDDCCGLAATVETDNVLGGEMAAEVLHGELGGSGTVLIFSWGYQDTPLVPTLKDRNDGCKDWLADPANYDDGDTPIDVVEFFIGFDEEWNFDDYAFWDDLYEGIEQNPGAGIFSTNLSMNHEVFGVLSEILYENPEFEVGPVVGFDLDQFGFNGILDGSLAAVISQDPFGMGVQGVQRVVDFYQSECWEQRPEPIHVLLEPVLVTAENAEDHRDLIISE